MQEVIILTDAEIFQEQQLVGKSEDFYSFRYIADKVSNNSNFSIQDESEFKKYYLKRKLEEACYNQDVYDFVINYDMGEFDNVSYSKVINYMDKMIAYNVFKPQKQKKVRFLYGDSKKQRNSRNHS